jgi:hypothetical protein
MAAGMQHRVAALQEILHVQLKQQHHAPGSGLHLQHHLLLLEHSQEVVLDLHA